MTTSIPLDPNPTALSYLVEWNPDNTVKLVSVNDLYTKALYSLSSSGIGISVLSFGAYGDGSHDDTTAIQTAINSLYTTGGILYFPKGTYRITRALIIQDINNLTLMGEGIDLVTIDSSATINPSAGSYTNPCAAWGVITIDTSTAGTTIKNIVLTGFTLKTSTNPAVSSSIKGIFLGAIDNCIIEKIKIDGCYNETINHIDCRNPINKVGKQFIVRYCEFINCVSNSVDSNSVGLNGMYVCDNYIHDCEGGAILLRGINLVCCRNLLRDLGKYGILAILEGGYPATYMQNNLIAENILDGIGKNYAIDSNRICIYAYSSTQFNDGGILICNNIVSNGYDGATNGIYGIYATGNIYLKNNIFRGLYTANERGYAICAGSDPYVGTNPAIQVIDGNIIESTVAGHGWLYGIILGSSVQNRPLVHNNIVMAGALAAAGQFALIDSNGYSRLEGNVFQDQVAYGGTSYNLSSEMDEEHFSTDKVKRILLPVNDTTPSVLGASRFYTTNTVPTTINNFDDGFVGKEIWITIGDTNTTLDLSGTHLFGNAGVDRAMHLNDGIHAVCIGGGYWHVLIAAYS